MRNRVAITGTGVISSLGDSRSSLHASLLSGATSQYQFEESNPHGFSGNGSGGIASFQGERYLKGKNLRPLDRTGQLVVAAAKLALADSGWTSERLAEQSVGLVLGTMFGSVHTIGKFDRHALEQGPACASPMDFANTVINAAAGQTAIWHNLRGVNSTIASGSSSGLAALRYATDLIRFSGQSAVLAGGADEFCLESFCGFDRAGMLHTCDASGMFPVPFHTSRTGFVVGEAASLIMLEEWDSAVARGARILAEVRGHGSTYDCSGGEGQQAARCIACAMKEALSDGKMSAQDVSCISASANASVSADRDEAVAIDSVFNGKAPSIPITAIKSMIGETLGASGSLQTIDMVETLRSRLLPGIRGLEENDSRLPKLNFSSDPREIRGWTGLINSVGLDGNVCSLLISGCPA